MNQSADTATPGRQAVVARTASMDRSVVGVDLQGGLGNQLFQYAVGRALSSQAGPILNFALLRHDQKRRLALDAYAIKGTLLDSSRLEPPGALRRALARVGLRTGDLRHFPFDAPVYQEDDSKGCWDPQIPELKPPFLLRGYFQSERYFAAIGATLRAEFVPIRAAGQTYLQIAQGIRSAGNDSVSVHIRRGDYASDPAVLAFHGILGGDYYATALGLLRTQVPAPHLFVFSDDPDAAATMVPTHGAVTMVSGRGLSDVDELSLMSLCRHHIIANSSFSWWGAWLGAAEGVTIAPRQWFARSSDASIRDRFPDHWHVIG